MVECSRVIGCSGVTVRNWLDRLNLDTGGRIERRVQPLEARLEPVAFSVIANKIVAPGVEKHLVPLLKFRGSADLGRVHRLWNFTLALKETGVETMGDAVKLANHPKFAHLCEPMKGAPYRHIGMFFNRLMLKPLVCSLEPGLLDYVRGIAPFHFELMEVSDIAHHRGHAWWREYAPRARTPEQIAAAQVAKLRPRATELMWPYIAHDPKKTSIGGTDIVAMVNSIVPKAIPEESRADICQDLILAVLEGKYSVDDIRDNPRKHIAAVRDHSPWKYEWVSLDAPLYGDEGLTLAETLAAPEW